MRLAFAALARAWTRGGGRGRRGRARDRAVQRAATARAHARHVEASWSRCCTRRSPTRTTTICRRGCTRASPRSRSSSSAIAPPPSRAGARSSACATTTSTRGKALERLLGRRGPQQGAGAGAREARRRCPNDLDEQKQLAYRAAELYEEALGEPEQAIATWRHVLTLDDERSRARSTRSSGSTSPRASWRDLSGVLTQKIELTPEPTAQRPLRLQLAQLSEHELHDALAAIDAYKGIARRRSRATSKRSKRWRGCTRPRGCAPITSRRSTRSPRRRPMRRKQAIELQFKAAQVLEREVGDAESGDRALSRRAVRPTAAGGDAVARRRARRRSRSWCATRRRAIRRRAVLEPFYEQHSDFHALDRADRAAARRPRASRSERRRAACRASPS